MKLALKVFANDWIHDLDLPHFKKLTICYATLYGDLNHSTDSNKLFLISLALNIHVT